jgi:hypothetical protein
VRTISGAVVRVDTVAERERAGSAVRLLLSTRAETLAVHVGPVWYLAAQPVRLAPGDSITVRGSRTSLDGAPLLVAAQVR